MQRTVAKALGNASPEFVSLTAIPDSEKFFESSRAGDGKELLLRLSEDPSIGIRTAAAHVLSALQNVGQTDNLVTQSLIALVKNENVDSWVRQFVDLALKQNERGNPDALIRLLLLFLVEDSEFPYWVRYSGVLLLAKLGLCGDKVIDNAILHDLSTWATNEELDSWIKCGAVIALSELGAADNTMVHSLMTFALDESKDTWSRQAAIHALGQLGPADDLVIRGLLVLARDEKVDANVQIDAAHALGRLGLAREAARLLLAFTRDDKADVDVQSSATRALGQLVLWNKEPCFVLALLELAGRHQSDIQNEAYNALKHAIENLRYVDVSRRTKAP